MEVSFVPMSDVQEKRIYFEAKEKRKLCEVNSGYTYFKNNDVLLAKITPCFENGKSGIAKNLINDIGFGSTEFIVIRPSCKLISELIYYFISDERFLKIGMNNMTGSAGQKRVPADIVRHLKIPLPPLSVQQEIVAELEGYQKVVDGARQVVENYKPKIKVDEGWEVMELGDVTHFIDYRGKTPTKTESGVPLITAKNVREGFISQEPREFISEVDYESWMTRGIPKKGDVLFTTEAPLGNVAQIETTEKIALAQRIITLQANENILIPSFLKNILLCEEMQKVIQNSATGSTATGIKAKTLRQIKIPLPPLDVQKEIVALIEEEQKLVDANKKLIELFEGKIKEKIAEVWG